MRNAILLVLIALYSPSLLSQAVPVTKLPDTSTGMITTAEVRGVLLDNDTDKTIKGMVGILPPIDLTLVHLEHFASVSTSDLLNMIKKKKVPTGTVMSVGPTWTIAIMPVKKKGKWGGGRVFTGVDKTGEFHFTGLEDGRYAVVVTNWASDRWLGLVQKGKLDADRMAPVAMIEIKDGQSVDLGTVYGYSQRSKRELTFALKKDATTGAEEIYVVEEPEKKKK